MGARRELRRQPQKITQDKSNDDHPISGCGYAEGSIRVNRSEGNAHTLHCSYAYHLNTFTFPFRVSIPTHFHREQVKGGYVTAALLIETLTTSRAGVVPAHSIRESSALRRWLIIALCLAVLSDLLRSLLARFGP